MLNFLRLFLALVFLGVAIGWLGQSAIAQDHEGCWMLNSAGAVIDLNGSVCPRSPTTSNSAPLVFSNLRVEPRTDGWVAVSGSIMNSTSQPMPLVLVEYKLVDQRSQEVLYKGIVRLETSGMLPAGASVNFSRVLRANRLPQKPLNEMTVQVARYL
ncbi:MAG TPA: hypothetical protein V6C63_05365 [Allocoleopsis sp.]